MEWTILYEDEPKPWRWKVKRIWKAGQLMKLYERYGNLPADHDWMIDMKESMLILRIRGGEQLYEMDIQQFYRKMSEGKKFKERMQKIENDSIIKFYRNYGKEDQS